jgi:DNA-directed RNA polymerase specialized sigma subunit
VILDHDQVRDLCGIRDAGIVAAAAIRESKQARALVGDANALELAQLVEAGAAARHLLIENGVGLVRFIIGQMRFPADWADVFQEGMLAVVKAVDSFDPDRGSFSGFMWPHIRGAVLKAMSTDSGRLHLTAGQARDRVLVLSELSHRQAVRSSATSADLAAALNISQARVDRALAFRPHTPLPDPLQGGVDLADGGPRASDPAAVPIDRFVGMLPAKERDLMQMMYGFSGAPRTSSQIAEAMGCSTRTVDRLRNEAHQHLRELLDHFGDSRGPAQSRAKVDGSDSTCGLDRPTRTGRGGLRRSSPAVLPADSANRSRPI